MLILLFIVIALLAMSGLSIVLLFKVIDQARELVKTGALDVVQVYSGFNMARLDVVEREAKIKLAKRTGNAQLVNDQRAARLAIVENRVRIKTGWDLHRK